MTPPFPCLIKKAKKSKHLGFNWVAYTKPRDHALAQLSLQWLSIPIANSWSWCSRLSPYRTARTISAGLVSDSFLILFPCWAQLVFLLLPRNLAWRVCALYCFWNVFCTILDLKMLFSLFVSKHPSPSCKQTRQLVSCLEGNVQPVSGVFLFLSPSL